MKKTTNSLPPIEKKNAKIYRSPQLIEYGNLQKLTNAVGMTGMMDGSGGSKTAP